MSKYRLISPLNASRLLYRFVIGRFPNLENPHDLNEKVIYLTHFSDTERWSEMADKYAVRGYVTETVGEDILIPLLQVADNPDEIDFDLLPSQFVIKTTDGFSRTLIVKDKSSLDVMAVRKMLRKWMRERLIGDESHYLRINRRLVIEQLLADSEGKIPTDYKFFCFDGEPLYCQACSNRNLTTLKSEFSVYRLPQWEDTRGVVEDGECREGAPKPVTLEKMMEISRKLAAPFKLARIDLYELDGKVYFGEVTMSAAAGRQKKFKQWLLDEMGEKVELGIGS